MLLAIPPLRCLCVEETGQQPKRPRTCEIGGLYGRVSSRVRSVADASERSSMSASDEPQPIVLVIDDDLAVREGLSMLFRSVGLQVKAFASAAEFLQSKLPDAPSCIVLDVRLPGLSGLDFQKELARADIHIPIVFMTGHGDIPMTVRAMKAGAVEFLSKPFRDQDMLDAVQTGLEQNRDRRRRTSDTAKLKASYDSLTAREQEIMILVTAGLMNKQIAGEVGISEVTVKLHRGNVMRKMGAKSLADLVRMADALGLSRRES
jgi:FixJ family two-component response regulator